MTSIKDTDLYRVEIRVKTQSLNELHTTVTAADTLELAAHPHVGPSGDLSDGHLCSGGLGRLATSMEDTDLYVQCQGYAQSLNTRHTTAADKLGLAARPPRRRTLYTNFKPRSSSTGPRLAAPTSVPTSLRLTTPSPSGHALAQLARVTLGLVSCRWPRQTPRTQASPAPPPNPPNAHAQLYG